ncbi:MULTISPECIES: hypothetical protein [unclassified Rhizobacter]|uniref:hypothetical protein n=1 Tax=unclassified Rhizobacter TaxID=2640088 RepID=UPI0012F97042|nr:MULTISPECIES: hypothetical protein [unclassified Rhizobacter]
MQAWWHTTVELLQSGRRSEAIELARRIAANGDLAASVRLAIFGGEAGITAEQADLIIERATAAAVDDDETVHWALRGAYDLRLGTCDYEEKSRRALKHLEAFAKITGSAAAVISVARTYATGGIGIPADLEAAVEWYHFAIALGEPGADAELQRLLVA